VVATRFLEYSVNLYPVVFETELLNFTLTKKKNI